MKKNLVSIIISFSLVITLFLPISHTYANGLLNKELLEEYIETYLEEQNIPGAAISIVQNDETIYAKGFGITGESEKEVTLDTPFLLGSISKSLTALAVMKLVEEGKIELDDPVQKYIPSFTLKDTEAASQITIQQLLTHTSGFSTFDGMSISDLGSNKLDAIQTNVQLLSNKELTAMPGAKHQYSNANYSILAVLIENVSGQSYTEFMDSNVFKPLSMNTAAADQNSAYERGYLSGYQSWFGFPVNSSVPFDNGGAPYGYITASANDMTNYLKALIQRDEKMLVNNELLDLSFYPHTQTGETRYYGFGWRISSPATSEEMIWHSGSTPNSRTDMFFFPESDWGGIILTNKEHILEEAALIYFRNGIISIMNGERPADVPTNNQIVQILLTVVNVGLAIKLFIKVIRKKPSLSKIRWVIPSSIMLVLSVIIMPLLMYFTASPWHTIQLFAADVALLTLILIALLAMNGLLSLYIGIKNRKM